MYTDALPSCPTCPAAAWVISLLMQTPTWPMPPSAVSTWYSPSSAPPLKRPLTSPAIDESDTLYVTPAPEAIRPLRVTAPYVDDMLIEGNGGSGPTMVPLSVVVGVPDVSTNSSSVSSPCVEVAVTLDAMASRALKSAVPASSRMPCTSAGSHAQKIVGTSCERGKSSQPRYSTSSVGLHTEQSSTATLFMYAFDPLADSSVKLISSEPTKRAPESATMPFGVASAAELAMTVPLIRMAPSKSPLAVRANGPRTRPKGAATSFCVTLGRSPMGLPIEAHAGPPTHLPIAGFAM
mmetsp:Transcript_36132/g.95215  ORF Transcript_36132/g.95215 Transcript_36132/m.95215 type:complete len:293 (+) Transcript_36132:591-1469(+)